MNVKLRLTGRQYEALRNHLLPVDGRESIAFALCGRRGGDSTHSLCVRRLTLIPNMACIERSSDRVTWSTAALRPLLDEATRDGSAIIKFHSHPSGYSRFSAQDDRSDQEFMSAVSNWSDRMQPNGSVVMLPDGGLFGRWMNENHQFVPLSSISVAGSDLRFWFSDVTGQRLGVSEATAQVFGAGTTDLLNRLSVVVVGCSGLGSPMIELLIRHGVRRLVLIDPDVIEERNLNRISFARVWDVGQLKVNIAAEWIASIGLGVEVVPIARSLCDPYAIKAAAECDIAVGCMDGAEGRYILNKLATFYCLPYFDVGVRLDADGSGGISQICGTVNYLQPDGSSLLSRDAITMEAVQAEGLRRSNPEAYAAEVAAKYIRGVQEHRPAVASVNFHYASLGMIEILARLHSFRVDGNAPFAQIGSSLTDPRFEPVRQDGVPCSVLSKHVGRGDVTPLLDNPYLSELAVA